MMEKTQYWLTFQNLPPETTWAQLKDFVRFQGEEQLTALRAEVDEDSRCGCVDFADLEALQLAYDSVNKRRLWKGYVLIVEKCTSEHGSLSQAGRVFNCPADPSVFESIPGLQRTEQLLMDLPVAHFPNNDAMILSHRTALLRYQDTTLERYSYSEDSRTGPLPDIGATSIAMNLYATRSSPVDYDAYSLNYYDQSQNLQTTSAQSFQWPEAETTTPAVVDGSKSWTQASHSQKDAASGTVPSSVKDSKAEQSQSSKKSGHSKSTKDRGGDTKGKGKHKKH